MDELRKPTTYTDDSGDWQNEGQAYDTATAGDETTCADDTGHLASADDDPDIRFHGVAAAGQTYTQLDIFFKWKTNDLTGNDQWGAVVSVDGGSSYPYTLLAKGTNRATSITHDTVNLPAGTDLTQVYVKIYKDKVAGGDGDTLYIYDIWLIGQYGTGPTPQLCQLTVTGSLNTKKKTKKDFTLAVIGTSGTKKKTKKRFALTVIGTATMSRFIDVARSFLLAVPGVVTMTRSIDVARTFHLVLSSATSVTSVKKFFKTCQLIVTASTGLGNFFIKKAISLVVTAGPTMTRFIDVARTFQLAVTGSTNAKKKTKKEFQLTIQAVTTCTAFRVVYQFCQLVITAVPALAKKIGKLIHMEIGAGVGVAGVQEATFKRMQSHGD